MRLKNKVGILNALGFLKTLYIYIYIYRERERERERALYL